MKDILYKACVVSVLALALIYVTAANAQNQSNVTAKENMTASKAMGNASAKENMTASKAVANASAGMNKTGSELGKNASQAGEQILNKTEDLGKKIAGGLGSLLGNASEKLKQSSK